MTRINCGIPVKELSDKHLMAEHREIKRIPNCIRKGRYNMDNQPKEFTLGTGHVKFFYDKLGYLKKRYINIYNECIRRDKNVTDFSEAWDGIDPKFMGDYSPTDRDRAIIRERIKERLNPNQEDEK